MNKSLTIVLPIHNAEARLRGCVDELLELASELTQQFAIQIIDDGSTDATYEVAEELAMRFPQVTVRRHRHRCGLGPALQAAQRHCRSEVVIVHDGVASLDPNQVRRLWRDCVVGPGGTRAANVAQQTTSLDDLSKLAAEHSAMEQAHARVVGFQLLTSPGDDEGSTSGAAAGPTVAPRIDTRPAAPRPGVGKIPPLPRPKFLSALVAFARDE